MFKLLFLLKGNLFQDASHETSPASRIQKKYYAYINIMPVPDLGLKRSIRQSSDFQRNARKKRGKGITFRIAS